MPLGSLPPPLDPTRIVIVDDDRVFVEMLHTALSEHDAFDVVGIAANGEEAMERVEELKPSLVLMDVTMPVLDGVEATRQMQELPEPPSVVLITGEDHDADTAAYEAGAVAYLRKTDDLPLLISVIVAVSRLSAAPA
jgi:CheY-like chemotaxis protein